jgi:hypothetical protein
MTVQVQERRKLRVAARRRGYWRSRWHSERDCQFAEGVQKAGVWLGIRRWPSAEVAEQKALDWMATHQDAAEAYGITFLGVVFFPGDRPERGA